MAARIFDGGRGRQDLHSMFSDNMDSSSFGPIGYIAPVSANRLKGFIGYTGALGGQDSGIVPIENSVHARFVGEVVREGIRRLQRRGCTRLTIRTIVRTSALNDLEAEVVNAGASIEATIPVNGDYTIAYIGYNTQERELSEKEMAKFKNNINKAVVQHGHDNASLAALARDIRSNTNDYSIRIIDGNRRVLSSAELASTYTLLGTFGYNSEQALAALSNENNMVGLVYANSGPSRRVVGISIIEQRSIQLSNGTSLHIAEVTDGTVSKEDNGRSLYSMLLLELFRHISLNRSDLNLVFGESNVSSDPLLKAAILQGRTFSGLLPNHAVIMNRDTNQLELKSLVVTYLTRDQLIASVVNVDYALAAQLQQAARA
ncbi:MAG: hypothetical protein M1569_03340 [Candidatus Marsarchaeota archaeon]|nr:hypothetical protein [Candidatus Marsarchaeota archaeon]